MPYTIDVFGASYAGGVALPKYEGEHPWGSAAAPNALVELPGGNAWDSLGTEAALPRAETITIRGEWIAASATAMQTKIDALKALTGTRNLLWASNDGGTTKRFRTARCLHVRAAVIPGAASYSVIEMDFELAAGAWKGAAHDETTVIDAGDHSVITNNGGNTWVRDAIITVTAKVAPITFLRVYDEIAPITRWAYTGTIAINKRLIVTCGTKRVWNENTGDDYANFALLAEHATPEWTHIEPGNKEWTVTTTSADHSAHEFKLTYNDWWM